ncbi:MAG TPA: hypothetical protein VHG72_13145, partial [Polyangia bacterium]|nr:hypothetical protein [Polyangia bacterium]
MGCPSKQRARQSVLSENGDVTEQAAPGRIQMRYRPDGQLALPVRRPASSRDIVVRLSDRINSRGPL